MKKFSKEELDEERGRERGQTEVRRRPCKGVKELIGGRERGWADRNGREGERQ